MSEVKELDATKSCESAVDMQAAIIAASSRPENTGMKNFLAITMNTVSWAPRISNSSPANILPRYATRHAAASARITHIMATIADFLIIEGFSIDINLTNI